MPNKQMRKSRKQRVGARVLTTKDFAVLTKLPCPPIPVTREFQPTFVKWVRGIVSFTTGTDAGVASPLQVGLRDSGDYGLQSLTNSRWLSVAYQEFKVWGPLSPTLITDEFVLDVYSLTSNRQVAQLSSAVDQSQTAFQPCVAGRWPINDRVYNFPQAIISPSVPNPLVITSSSPSGDYVVDVLCHFR